MMEAILISVFLIMISVLLINLIIILKIWFLLKDTLYWKQEEIDAAYEKAEKSNLGFRQKNTTVVAEAPPIGEGIILK